MSSGSDPDVAVGGLRVGVGEEAMSKELLDLLEGVEGDGTLRSFREIVGEEGIRNGDGVGHVEFLVFSDRGGEFAEGDGNRGFRGKGDVVFHVCEGGPGEDRDGRKR